MDNSRCWESSSQDFRGTVSLSAFKCYQISQPQHGNLKERTRANQSAAKRQKLATSHDNLEPVTKKQSITLVPIKELVSSQALPLLEQVVRLSGMEKNSDKMDEAFARVVGMFCACLDHRELRLGDLLAQGSLAVSLEVLHAYRQQELQFAGPPSPERSRRPSAAGPESGDNPTQGEKGRRGAFEWSAHKFAAIVFQKHLKLEAEAAASVGRRRVAPKPFGRGAAADMVGMESEDRTF
eukprot:s2325_g5.t1